MSASHWRDAFGGGDDVQCQMESSLVRICNGELQRINTNGTFVLRIPLHTVISLEVKRSFDPISLIFIGLAAAFSAIAAFVSTHDLLTCSLYVVAALLVGIGLFGCVACCIRVRTTNGNSDIHCTDTLDKIVPMLSKSAMAGWYDHYVGICALWEFESGHFAEVENVLTQGDNADYYVLLRIRVKLCLVRQDYPQAEKLSRQYQEVERKKGLLHRPELLKMTLDFAEALFGQGKHAV